MSNTRIYIVQAKGKTGVEDTVLVDAATAAQALRFVAAQAFESRVATAKDVATYVAKGVKVWTPIDTISDTNEKVQEAISESAASSAKHEATGG